MKSKNTKSSDELKSEVLQQLSKVNTDINHIQERMTPGQLIDDMIFYPRGANVGTSIDLMKNNPVGATFLTLGTLLLMEDKHKHKTFEHIAKSQAKEMAKDLKANVQDKISEEPFKSLGEEVSTDIQEGIEAVKKLDPMIYVAVGAGLGALAGISLPETDTEKQMVGEKLDAMTSSFTHELQDALNESAGVLKDLVAADLKSLNIEVFHR